LFDCTIYRQMGLPILTIFQVNEKLNKLKDEIFDHLIRFLRLTKGALDKVQIFQVRSTKYEDTDSSASKNLQETHHSALDLCMILTILGISHLCFRFIAIRMSPPFTLDLSKDLSQQKMAKRLSKIYILRIWSFKLFSTGNLMSWSHSHASISKFWLTRLIFWKQTDKCCKKGAFLVKVSVISDLYVWSRLQALELQLKTFTCLHHHFVYFTCLH
jgi:hypothetical protein